MEEFKVKNLSDDPRQFFDRWKAKNIILQPGEEIMTTAPPKAGEMFDVTKADKKEEKSTKKKTSLGGD